MEEPESQIVPPDYELEYHIPSSPLLPASMAPPEACSGHSRARTGIEEFGPQAAELQPDNYASCIRDTQFELVEMDTQAVEVPRLAEDNHPRHHTDGGETQYPKIQLESCVSRIEETQFQSIEIDTQAVEDSNLLAMHRTSQFCEARELSTSAAPVKPTSQTTQMLSRPDSGGLDDLTNGFTFGKFEMPPKGHFNRPALPAKSRLLASQPPNEARAPVTIKSQHAVEERLDGSQLTGLTAPLLPNVTEATPPDAPSCPSLLQGPSLIKDLSGLHVKNHLAVDGNHAQAEPQQESPPVPIAVQDPQISIAAAVSGRPAAISSNKSHKRIKKPFPKPFPDEDGLSINRRWLGNRRSTSFYLMESPLKHVKHMAEVAAAEASTNIVQTGNLAPSVNVHDNNRQRHHSASVLRSSHTDMPRVIGRPVMPIALDQQASPTQPNKMGSAPFHHISPALNTHDQMTAIKPVHAIESTASLLPLHNVGQQQSDPSRDNEATHSRLDKPMEAVVEDYVMKDHSSHEGDIQEIASKPPVNVAARNAQEQIHLASSQAGDVSEGGLRHRFSIPSRVPSRAHSEAPERPESRRSNCGKPITRPIPPQDLRPQEVGEIPSRLQSRSTSFKNSSNGLSNPVFSEAFSKPAVSGQHRQKSRHSPKFFEEYSRFLENGQEILEIMKDYEQQTQLVDAQQTEIEKLRDTSDSSIKQINELEKEKADLSAKLRRFAEISSKYKKHMNEVVKAQKYLKIQANEIQKNTKEVANEVVEKLKSTGEIHTATVTAMQKIKTAVTDAKSFEAKSLVQAFKQNQYLKTATQTLQNAHEQVQDANNKLHDEKQKLQDEIRMLQEEQEKLAQDNNKLQIDLGAATKNSQLLEAMLEKRLMELSREKHLLEQLEKPRGEQLDSHKVLVELLKNLPAEVADEISKEGGVLAKVLDSGKATQAKVDNGAFLGTNSKNQEAEPSASLIKLIEDLFSRCETFMQACNNGATAQQESSIKLLDDFKTTVNQLRLDKKTELQLNNQICELGWSNDALIVEKNTLEQEIKNLTNQVDELKRDLAKCRGQLNSKNDELVTALAAPKEDSWLRAKIQDLETARDGITSQLESSKQELAKLKEELGAFQESARHTEQQSKDWKRKFNEIQSRIKCLQEEKTRLLARKQQEIEEACQEERQRIAKAAEASKATLKMRLESEVSHLERKVKEKDAELVLVKEQLRTAQDGSASQVDKSNILQRELFLYKERFIQQMAQLKRLEEQNPGREACDRLADNLQSVRNECTELRNHLETIRTENNTNTEAVMRGQQVIEGNLRQIDTLENENEKLKEGNEELQKRLESCHAAYSQQEPLHTEPQSDQSSIAAQKKTAFVTPQGIFLRHQQNQDPRRASGHASSLESGSTLKNDIFLDRGLETPEDALRKAARGIVASKSGSQVGKAVQAPSMASANKFERPPIQSQGALNEGSTNSKTLNPGISARSQSLHAGQRSLKVATRKHGTFRQGSGPGTVIHELNGKETFAQGVQEACTGDSSLCYINVADVPSSSGITPFAAVASSIPTPSPITDLSSMMDELGSLPDQEQLQEAYAKARGKKGDAADAKIAGVRGHQNFAWSTMNSFEKENAERDAADKFPTRKKSISTEGEALRRRTAQPTRSAIKKPKTALDVVSASEPRPVTIFEPSSKPNHKGKMATAQIQDGPRGSYNRAVSGGKPQTLKTGTPYAANGSAQGPSDGVEHSPNRPPPKRNALKRASLSGQTQAAPKRVRTSRGMSLAHRDVVPDSQENMQTV